MLLNEIMRRLHDSDPQVRYVVAFLYEAFNEQQKQIDMMSNIIQAMAKGFDTSARQTANLTERIYDLEHFGQTAGVSVSSVANDPEDR